MKYSDGLREQGRSRDGNKMPKYSDGLREQGRSRDGHKMPKRLNPIRCSKPRMEIVSILRPIVLQVTPLNPTPHPNP